MKQLVGYLVQSESLEGHHFRINFLYKKTKKIVLSTLNQFASGLLGNAYIIGKTASVMECVSHAINITPLSHLCVIGKKIIFIDVQLPRIQKKVSF